MRLDRVDLARDLAEHGRRVAEPGADLEHRLVAFQAQRLDHQRDDVRLRNRLAARQRLRRILVRELLEIPAA